MNIVAVVAAVLVVLVVGTIMWGGIGVSVVVTITVKNARMSE